MIKYREENQISRHDLIDALMKAKNGNALKSPDIDASPHDTKISWNHDDLAAQGMLFFLSGYETVS